MPLLPQIYSPSIFSRKNVQSMFLSGIATGRTAANRSNERRSRLLALTMFGHSSPGRGVTIGPFSSTSHCLTCSSTLSGRLCPRRARSSMVIPLTGRNSSLPAAISSFARNSSTRNACCIMIGPMPSPGRIPTTMRSSCEKSFASPASFIASMRASSEVINSANFA